MTRKATHNKDGERIIKPIKAGPGIPCPITQELVENVCRAVKDVYVQTHVAGLLGISDKSLSRWLDKGKEALDELDEIAINKYDGIKEHPYAYLYVRYRRARAELVKDLCCDVRNNENKVLNHGAQWLVERAFRAEFGSDAMLVQQLVERMASLEEMLTKQSQIHD